MVDVKSDLYLMGYKQGIISNIITDDSDDFKLGFARAKLDQQHMCVRYGVIPTFGPLVINIIKSAT